MLVKMRIGFIKRYQKLKNVIVNIKAKIIILDSLKEFFFFFMQSNLLITIKNCFTNWLITAILYKKIY